MGRITLYANINDDEVKFIDELAEKLGYSNRTDIVTALLQSLAYGTFRRETQEVNDILSFADEVDRLRNAFMEIIDEFAFPVIAMRGAETAFLALKEDLKGWMYERHQIVPQEEDMKKWLELYYAVNFGKIQRYRLQRMTEDYAEKHNNED